MDVPAELMPKSAYKSLLLLLALPLLNGCLVHTRTVKQAKMPTTVLTATADDLIKSVNQRCETIHSLSATADFQATVGGPKKGKEKTYTSFTGYILLRKPESVRVIGLVPVLHTRAFDMASNGQTFKVWIPSKNRVIEGTNAVTKPSQNALENMRPNIFFDSLLIGCIAPDELVTLTEENKTELDAKTKQLLVQPNYNLTVVHQVPNSQQLIPERVIHFSRTDLRPVQEDIYDAKGAIETQAIYGPLATYGAEKFPGVVTIKRPLEEYQIQLTISKLTVNLDLKDTQFELEVPKDVTVQKMD